MIFNSFSKSGAKVPSCAAGINAKETTASILGMDESDG
jgi:hypothetical protein